MKTFPVPSIPAGIVTEMRSLFAAGVPQPKVIAEMRAAGLHIMDCMKLVREFYGVSYAEAKATVHSSDAWADMRPGYDAFHESALEAAQQAGFEEAADTLRAAS